jgi:protein-L-isoaspartate(D-aspartate) O-methyltransferase
MIRHCQSIARRLAALLPPALPALTALLVNPPAAAEDPYAPLREDLVREIEDQVAMLGDELGFERLDPAVAQAMRTVHRHAFVPAPLRFESYGNHPLPIGYGQTISQPFIVAIMSDLLDVKPGDKVYELGTGSGYQAAVLGAMGVEVWSVEIVPELAARAEETLSRLGYGNVHVRAGDGYLGWPEAAPFDGVIMTAALDHVPQPLVDQLKPGGRLIMPIGDTPWGQQLVVMEKTAEGTLERRDLLPVRFVPVTGDGAEAGREGSKP